VTETRIDLDKLNAALEAAARDRVPLPLYAPFPTSLRPPRELPKPSPDTPGVA
jgi:hypothetical protein